MNEQTHTQNQEANQLTAKLIEQTAEILSLEIDFLRGGVLLWW